MYTSIFQSDCKRKMISLDNCKDVVIWLKQSTRAGGLFTLGARHTSLFLSSTEIIQTIEAELKLQPQVSKSASSTTNTTRHPSSGVT